VRYDERNGLQPIKEKLKKKNTTLAAPPTNNVIHRNKLSDYVKTQ
jgi:hypothetical protein